jgi:ribosome-associated translation inhibitor RaiA
MAERPVVVISFHEVEADEELRGSIDRRCHVLADDFPETTRFEITLSPDGNGHTAHARVHARQLEIETQGDAIELGAAAEAALDKVARRLRREHDKRIDTRRRAAQKSNPKRGS